MNDATFRIIQLIHFIHPHTRTHSDRNQPDTFRERDSNQLHESLRLNTLVLSNTFESYY